MSYLFGIVDLEGRCVDSHKLQKLSESFKSADFEEKLAAENFYALGFCWRKDREPNAEIVKLDHIVVIADIRLYNMEDLKKYIDFSTPTEAIAKGYLRWGKLFAQKLNGDFAAVVIDKLKKEVTLFRDHIGSRPLAYHFHQNQLMFASNEFGLAQTGFFPVSLSESTLVNRMFRVNGNYHETSFDEIFKVVPGYCATFRPDHLIFFEYWKIKKIRKNKNLSFDDAVNGLRERIVKATLNRTAPGKIGVHVSGGLDSTGIASILADFTSSDAKLLTGYSWSPEKFEGKRMGEVDEKMLIDRFIADKGIPVKYLNLDKYEYTKDQLLVDFEYQTIEHPIMKMASKDNIPLLFSGWGGDEFISAGHRGIFNYLFFTFKWIKLFLWIRYHGIKAALKRFRVEVLPVLIPFGLLYVFQPFRWSLVKDFKFSFVCRNWKTIFFNRQKNIFGFGSRMNQMISLLRNYHIPSRMDSWALYGELYGIEYRYPLLDKELLEFWFSIPEKFTCPVKASRLLFREALKGILTEELRLRDNKGEALRISYTFENMRHGFKYFEEKLNSLSESERPSIFKHARFSRKLTIPLRTIRDEIRLESDLLYYLKYAELTNTYVKSQNEFTNAS